MRTADGGDVGGDGESIGGAFVLIGSVRTFRVNSDQTTTPVVNVTAQSVTFGVVFTWTVLASTWDADGPAAFVPLKTAEVNTICAHPHVQDFRTEQDQGPSQVLYNYAVITVGTDDQAITDEVRQRMDQIGLPSVFAAIDHVWGQLAAAGAA